MFPCDIPPPRLTHTRPTHEHQTHTHTARDDLNSPSSPKRVHSRVRVECDYSSSTSEALVIPPLPPSSPPHPACAHTPPDIFSVAAHPPLARYAPTVEARPNQVLRVSTCRLSLKPGVRRRTSSHPNPNLIPQHAIHISHHTTLALLLLPPSHSPRTTPHLAGRRVVDHGHAVPPPPSATQGDDRLHMRR